MVIGRGLAAVHHHRDCQSYLYYLLSTAFSNEDIIGNGAIFSSAGKDELLGFKVLSPPDELVYVFEKRVKPIGDQIAGLIRQNKVLEKTKNQLLPRLISGKLSVENLDIQFPPPMQSDRSDNADEAAA
jgi:type I restriction enzyme S subunit